MHMQARHAVDLGRARAALARLAVPAHGQVAGLLGLDLVHGVEHDHALRDLGRVVAEARRPARRRARCGRSRAPSLHLLDDLLQLGRHLRDRRRGSSCMPPSGPLRTTRLSLPKRRVLVREVLAEVAAAALLALERRARDRLGDREQVVRGRAPCASPGCTRGCPCTRDALRALRAGSASPSSARCISSSRRTMPTRSCIISCRSCWTAYGSLASPSAARTARAPAAAAASTCAVVDPAGRVRRARSCAACSPARLPNTSRSESELPPSRLAPLMPAAHSPAANRPGTVDICVSASTRTPPIM